VAALPQLNLLAPQLKFPRHSSATVKILPPQLDPRVRGYKQRAVTLMFTRNTEAILTEWYNRSS
jgi:hypothetical protein